jgi:hypothetical protein
MTTGPDVAAQAIAAAKLAQEQANRSPPKTKPPTANGSQIKARVEKLEADVQVLAWLHTEQQQRVVTTAATVAGLVADQMQPRVKQEILRRLMG